MATKKAKAVVKKARGERKPTHPTYARLEEAMEKKYGIKGVAAVGRKTGMTPWAAGYWRTSGVGAKKADDIEALLGIRAAWIMNGERPMGVTDPGEAAPPAPPAPATLPAPIEPKPIVTSKPIVVPMVTLKVHMHADEAMRVISQIGEGFAWTITPKED